MRACVIMNLIFFAHFVRFSTKMYYFCNAFSKEPRKQEETSVKERWRRASLLF